MRDLADNVVIVCSIENIDPMGVHTGDSITVAPAQTLTDREYQRMRDAAVAIIREIGIECGGSNVQFAVNPADGELMIIEMNPRVSRSSALASKATGFPIAKMAAKAEAMAAQLDDFSLAGLAFGASLLVRAMFADQGIKIDPLYVRTHSNVNRAVIEGDVAAGGGIKATLSAEPPEVQALLKVIYESDEFSPHPIATKPTVSDGIRKAFFDAFVSCAQDMTCKKLLGQIDFVNPVKVSDADYANVEALHIERLQQ
jgi:hypothetical protein